MRRRTFDTLVSVGGLVLAFVLIVAGALLTWSALFINGQVHDQLAAQQIFFPAAGSDAIKAPEFAAMQQYAGQQLTTGDQAEVYARPLHRQPPQGDRRRQDVRAGERGGPGRPDQRRSCRARWRLCSRVRRCAACC